MVQGVWRDIPRDFKSTGGAFVRPDTAFRESVSLADAEPGRYRLYVSRACPWAHRTLIMRAFARLEKVPVFNADSLHGRERLGIRRGQRRHPLPAPALRESEARLHRPGERAGLGTRNPGGSSINESSEIIRMMGTDLYPAKLRKEIDAVNERVYQTSTTGSTALASPPRRTSTRPR